MNGSRGPGIRKQSSYIKNEKIVLHDAALSWFWFSIGMCEKRGNPFKEAYQPQHCHPKRRDACLYQLACQETKCINFHTLSQ